MVMTMTKALEVTVENNFTVHTKRTLEALPLVERLYIQEKHKIHFKYKRGDIVYHCFMF
ncbi:UNVERIFIED_ORG: hypothetical protein GCAPEGMB_00527 [Vibrio phage V07]